MSRKIGFAIIGCGLVAPFHARAISALPETSLVAVTDLDFNRAERLAREYGGAAVSDYRRLLGRPDVDVVCICTPNGTHEEIAVSAAQAGKHLLIEKPIEVTISKADRIIAEAERSGVKLAVAFQCRFRPAVACVRRAIEQGRFGRLLCGDVFMKWYRSEEYYRNVAWRGQPEQGGGVLLQQASHYIDLLQWLLGPIESVIGQTANLAHRGIAVEDTALALLKYCNGAVGVIESTTAVYPGVEVRLEIHGENGSAIVEGTAIRLWKFREEAPEDQEIARNGTPSVAAAANGAANFHHLEHQLLIADLVAAIREDREPAVNGREGRKALEIIQAIYRSAREERAVSPMSAG